MRSLTDTLTMDYFEAVCDIVMTKEAARLGAIAEATVRDIVIDGSAKFVDGQLLDPSVSGSTARPASLLNGAPTVTSTGSTAAQIIADLSSLLALITTPGDGLRWVMKSTTYYAIAAKLAGAGMPLTPGYLLTIPVVMGSTSPQQIALIDCDAIAYASDDAIGLDVATHASIEMSDSPSQDGAAGTGAALVNLFQVGAIAIRARLGVNWTATHYEPGSPAQPSGVAYMTVTY
jgi:hypothetical protein